jgi:DNA-binding Lrp family transcriptional regulator
MESVRLPRFKRAAQITPFQLTERDRKIIRLIHRHRFLRSPQIVSLLNESTQPVLRRLQLLFHHGYLERPRAQIDYYHQGGSRHIVYGLGNKGAALIGRELGKSFAKIMWGDKNRAVSRLFLEHALLVSDVMVALELACRQAGTVRLITAAELTSTEKSFQWQVNVSSRLRLGVIPDQVFALEFPGRPDGQNRAYFFLEADRATMPVTRANLSRSSFYRKLLAYEATWSQQIHRSHFGFQRFRVLTITTSQQRVNSLAETCSQLEKGHGLFLFGDLSTFIAHTNRLVFPFLTGQHGKSSTLME